MIREAFTHSGSDLGRDSRIASRVFENNPAAQIVGIDLRLVHLCFISVEVQHDSTMVRCATIADCGEVDTLALLLPVFGGQNGPRIVYYNTVLRVTNALSEGLKTARIHRKSPSFAICHSSLLPAILQNGEQKSGVTTR